MTYKVEEVIVFTNTLYKYNHIIFLFLESNAGYQNGTEF